MQLKLGLDCLRCALEQPKHEHHASLFDLSGSSLYPLFQAWTRTSQGKLGFEIARPGKDRLKAGPELLKLRLDEGAVA